MLLGGRCNRAPARLQAHVVLGPCRAHASHPLSGRLGNDQLLKGDGVILAACCACDSGQQLALQEGVAPLEAQEAQEILMAESWAWAISCLSEAFSESL